VGNQWVITQESSSQPLAFDGTEPYSLMQVSRWMASVSNFSSSNSSSVLTRSISGMFSPCYSSAHRLLTLFASQLLYMLGDAQSIGEQLCSPPMLLPFHSYSCSGEKIDVLSRSNPDKRLKLNVVWHRTCFAWYTHSAFGDLLFLKYLFQVATAVQNMHYFQISIQYPVENQVVANS
jgi:hypothetical protein